MRTRRWPWLVVVAMCCAAAPAGATEDEASSGTFAATVASAADDSLGDDAPEAVARAYNAGFDVAQVLTALLDDAVSADGSVRGDDGRVQTPVRQRSTFVTGTTGGSDPKLDAALARTTTQVAKTTRNEAVGAEIATMMVLLGLAAEGYSTEQILVDGLFGGGIRWSPDGVEIRDEKGKRVKPAGEDCCASIEDPDERESTSDVIDTFVVDSVELLAGIDPAGVSAGDYRRDFAISITVDGKDADGSQIALRTKGNFGRGATKDWRGFLAGSGTGTFTSSGACSIGNEATKHPWAFAGDIEFGVSGRLTEPSSGGQSTANVRAVFAPSNVTKTTGDSSGCVTLAEELAHEYVAAIPFPVMKIRLKDGETATQSTTFGDATFTLKVALS